MLSILICHFFPVVIAKLNFNMILQKSFHVALVLKKHCINNFENSFVLLDICENCDTFFQGFLMNAKFT